MSAKAFRQHDERNHHQPNQRSNQERQHQEHLILALPPERSPSQGLRAEPTALRLLSGFLHVSLELLASKDIMAHGVGVLACRPRAGLGVTPSKIRCLPARLRLRGEPRGSNHTLAKSYGSHATAKPR